MTTVKSDFIQLIGEEIIRPFVAGGTATNEQVNTFVVRLRVLGREKYIINLQDTGNANKSAYGVIYGFSSKAPSSLRNLLLKLNTDTRSKEQMLFEREGMIQDIVWRETPGNRLTPRPILYSSVFMVMERIEGKSVAGLIQGPMNKANKASISKQIQGAIRRLHSLGFIHLDLHPGNLMYGRIAGTNGPRKIWIIDFGKAVHYYDMVGSDNNKTTSNKVVGAYALAHDYYLSSKVYNDALKYGMGGGEKEAAYARVLQFGGEPERGILAQPTELFARINNASRTLVNDIMDPRGSKLDNQRKTKFITRLRSVRGSQVGAPGKKNVMNQLMKDHHQRQRVKTIPNRLNNAKAKGNTVSPRNTEQRARATVVKETVANKMAKMKAAIALKQKRNANAARTRNLMKTNSWAGRKAFLQIRPTLQTTNSWARTPQSGVRANNNSRRGLLDRQSQKYHIARKQVSNNNNREANVTRQLKRVRKRFSNNNNNNRRGLLDRQTKRV